MSPAFGVVDPELQCSLQEEEKETTRVEGGRLNMDDACGLPTWSSISTKGLS